MHVIMQSYKSLRTGPCCVPTSKTVHGTYTCMPQMLELGTAAHAVATKMGPLVLSQFVFFIFELCIVQLTVFFFRDLLAGGLFLQKLLIFLRQGR
jgi:hypothetical protein